jgi:tetratricopeptide (TPR) repeat protein
MSTSGKSPKTAATKKNTLGDNVVEFAPKAAGKKRVSEADLYLGRTPDPLDQAQGVIYEAWESRDKRRRITLARKALSISPLCADAYNILAQEAAATQEEALAYYQQAVRAGEQALGREGFEQYAGHFWGFLETRPYMRARLGLGEALWVTGEKDAAIQNFKEMLELNPGDNQGIRYILAAKLLDIGRIGDLKSLLTTCADEFSTDIQYTRALIAYLDGARDARKIAKLALETNEHVPGMLSGRLPMVQLGDYITMGGLDEASSYVGAFGAGWRRISGSIAWLEGVTGPLKRK